MTKMVILVMTSPPGVQVGERGGEDGEVVGKLYQTVLRAGEAREGRERPQPWRKGDEGILGDDQGPTSQSAGL